MRSAVFAIGLLAASGLSLLVVSSAHAANYGSYVGSTVVFENVTDQNGLYGAPTVSADSLDFNPNAFEAGCPLNGCVSELVDDTLTFTIQATNGNVIEDVVLSEAGDFNLSTFVDGDLAVTSVSANIFVDILEIDGVAVNNINANTSMVFTNAGSFLRDWSADGTGTTPGTWTGNLTLDLDAIITGAGAIGQATRVTLNINNTLTAFAGGSALAFIEKKDFDGLAVTVVPEPGTAVLMMLGLLGLASSRGASNRS